MPGICSFFAQFFNYDASSECQQFMIVGPPKSGKTTLLYRLRIGTRWVNMEQDLKDLRLKQETPSQTDDDKNSDRKREDVEYDRGYHYEEFSFLSSCGFWDIPDSLRPVWSTWYKSLTIHGIFLVVCAGKENQPDDREDESRTPDDQIVEYKRALQALMNEDELRKAVVTVIVNVKTPWKAVKENQRVKDKDKEKDKGQTERHEFYYRLGLHELPPSVSWRVGFFVVDVNRIDGEKDPSWKPIEQHLIDKLSSEKGFNLDFG